MIALWTLGNTDLDTVKFGFIALSHTFFTTWLHKYNNFTAVTANKCGHEEFVI